MKHFLRQESVCLAVVLFLSGTSLLFGQARDTGSV